MRRISALAAKPACLQASLQLQLFCAGQQVRQVGTLLLAEPKADGSGLASSTFNTLTAAQALRQPITALVAGQNIAPIAGAAASLQGVTQVLVADHAGLQLPEPLAALVQALQSQHKFDFIVAPSSSWGKAVLPRLGALLGVQPVADVTRVVDPSTYVRPIYAGNALATVKYQTPPPAGTPRLLTVRPSAFPATSAPAAQAAPQQPVAGEALQAAEAQAALGHARLESRELTKSERPELASAKVVVCGGRALKSAENFKILESLADALGGAVGASRAAVDAGMVPNDLQIGQTGKVVAPALYIGCGVSGAIQHLAGIKDAGTIVAINNNPEAEIFQVADHGLVEDLFVAVPELEKEVRKLKAQG